MAKKKPQKVRKVSPVAPQTPPTLDAPVVAPTSAPTTTPVLTETPKVPEQPKSTRKPISVGIWAYFIGIIIAFAAVLFVSDAFNYYTYAALAILGFMVGLLNIRDDEIMLFLVASVAFVVSSYSVRTVVSDAPGVAQFLANIIVFTAASAFIVSLKALVRVARDE